MRSTLRLAVFLMLPLALAACKGEKKNETGTAQGEILEGSASDAMLPLDTVRSQPPLAPEATSSGKPGKDRSESEADAAASDEPSEATATSSAAPAAPSPAASAAAAQ